jgi:hypothetical protein
MFTKICNTWSSGYPFFDITKYVVDEVISLNIVAQSWMWWCFSLIPIIRIPPWSLLSSWTWSWYSSSSSCSSWSSSCAGRVVSFGDYYWDWSFGSCSLTSPIAILCNASHGASSSSTRSRSTCIRRGFNTTGGHIENTVCVRVWIITMLETFLNFRSKFRRLWPFVENIGLTSERSELGNIRLIMS